MFYFNVIVMVYHFLFSGVQYADKLYGPEHSLQEDNSVNDSDSEDIEEALAKEVEQLQQTKKEKRFQTVLTGAVNVIFIKTNLPDSKDPTDLVHTILTDMLKTGCKKTRWECYQERFYY